VLPNSAPPIDERDRHQSAALFHPRRQSPL